MPVCSVFIDADSSGRVHWKAINHYAIPEKYLIVQLLPYKDTQQEFAAWKTKAEPSIPKYSIHWKEAEEELLSLGSPAQ